MTNNKQEPDARASGWYSRTLGRITRSGRPLWLAIAAAAVVAVAIYSVMSQEQREQTPSADPTSPAGLVLPDQGSNTSLAAVGPLRGLDQPCTGWLVAPQQGPVAVSAQPNSETSEPTVSASPTSPAAATGVAYAVTAAQCVGITDSAEVISGRKLTGATLGLTAFASVTSAVSSPMQEVPVTEVVWASARWRNLAVLRLGATYEALRSSGIQPIQLSGQPTPGTTVLAASVPIAGIPADQQYLRIAKCQAGDVVDVLSGPWIWTEQQTSDCRGILEGSLGGIVFDPAGSALGMIVGTTIGTAASPAQCTATRPCQVSGGSVSSRPDTTYLQGMAALGGCFRESGFKLGRGCELENPQTAVPAVPETSAAQPGATVSVALVGNVTGEVAAKYGELGSVVCQDEVGWGRPVPAERWRMRMVLPSKPGWLLGCVGTPAQPTPVVVAVDTTPPDAATAELQVTSAPGGRMVSPVLDPPEFAAFLWTSGPANAIDCAIAEGYQRFRGEPALIEFADLPAEVCLIAVDSAGNKSTPVTRKVD